MALLRSGPRARADLLALALGSAGDPSDHPIRDRILEVVARYPGLHLRDLCREVDLPVGHAEHHLRVLVERGRLAESREGGYLRYWPTRKTVAGRAHELDPEERETVRFLRRPTTLKVLVQLALHEDQGVRELAEAVSVSPSTAHYHLSKLEEAGLAERFEQEQGVRWRAVDREQLEALLRAYEPPPRHVKGFLDTWDRLGP